MSFLEGLCTLQPLHTDATKFLASVGETWGMREMEIQDDEQNEKAAEDNVMASTPVKTLVPAFTFFSLCSLAQLR